MSELEIKIMEKTIKKSMENEAIDLAVLAQGLGVSLEELGEYIGINVEHGEVMYTKKGMELLHNYAMKMNG